MKTLNIPTTYIKTTIMRECYICFFTRLDGGWIVFLFNSNDDGNSNGYCGGGKFFILSMFLGYVVYQIFYYDYAQRFQAKS